MDYSTLLDLSAELGYRLSMAGAETFRVEESITRVLNAYGIASEVFVIPNCLHVSIETADGTPMTRMRRIGHHGNDLDTVERYNSLSRRICAEKPEPELIRTWLEETKASCRQFPFWVSMIGHFVAGAGFTVFFGGAMLDALLGGICGVIIGLVNFVLDFKKVNSFFATIASAFFMAFAAYAFGALGITQHADAIIIGALMLLVPGLLFTNAMRDIIFGDTNSGTNRIVQVLLIAAAIALGTGVAWNLASVIWELPASASPIPHHAVIQCIGTVVGCIGFIIVFNIHGMGFLLCSLGGAFAWVTYKLTSTFVGSEILGYFFGGVIAAVYAEIMARVRKYPAISYLVVSIFPLIPGAGIYYATEHLVRKEMELFTEKSTQTIAIAGVLAVGILMVSTIVRLLTVKKQHK